MYSRDGQRATTIECCESRQYEITDRRDASLAAAALGISLGCRVIRVHDVQGTRRVRDILEAVSRAQ